MTFEDVNWMQNKTYSAREDRQIISGLVGTEGVFSGHVASQRGAGANMSVDITAGRSAVQGDDQANQGMYVMSNISTDNVVIGAAPGSNSRIDLVCIRVNDPNATGPAGDNGAYVVVAGAVAASPVPPALPTSAIPIAQVLVATGTAAITNAMITDVRAIARSFGEAPFGVPMPYAGAEASVPADFALARGQALSRSTYFGLFRVIGTTYGAGDGSTTFNLPDLRGRIPVGLDNMGGADAGVLSLANTLGLTGGTQTHALSTAELAAHTHTTPAHFHSIDPPNTTVTITDPGHTHLYDANDFVLELATGIQKINAIPGGNDTATASATTGITAAVNIAAFNSASDGSGTSGSEGSGTAHNNMQPYILMNWIMRIV